MDVRSTVAALMVFLCVTGCGGALAHEVAEEVPEPLITESLRTVQERDTRELILKAAAIPEIEGATQLLVGSVTDGSLQALSEEERAERIAELVEGFVARVSRSLASAAGEEIAPVLSRTVAHGLQRALVRLTAEPNRDRLALLARTIANAGAEQLGYGLSEALRDPAVQLTIAQTSRTIGRALALGAGEAIDELEEQRLGSLSAQAGMQRASSGLDAEVESESASWAGISVLVIAALLIAVLAHSVLQIRRRDRALLAVADAIKDAEGEPWENDLRATLGEAFRDNPDADYLRKLLRRNPALRLGTRSGASRRQRLDRVEVS